MVKFQNTETIKYRSDVEQDEMQNDTATLTISYKTEHIRTKWSSNHFPWYWLKAFKMHQHKNLHVDVYCSFILNCQNVDVAKMYFTRWTNK